MKYANNTNDVIQTRVTMVHFDWGFIIQSQHCKVKRKNRVKIVGISLVDNRKLK
jgi:hypothetical protein